MLLIQHITYVMNVKVKHSLCRLG